MNVIMGKLNKPCQLLCLNYMYNYFDDKCTFQVALVNKK